MKKLFIVLILVIALCFSLCACSNKGTLVFEGGLAPETVAGHKGQQAVTGLRVYSNEGEITLTYILEGAERSVTGRFAECRPRSSTDEVRFALCAERSDPSFLACYYSAYSSPHDDMWVFESFGMEYDPYAELHKKFELSNFVLAFRDPEGGIGYFFCADPEFSQESVREISSHAVKVTDGEWEELISAAHYPEILYEPSLAGSFAGTHEKDPFIMTGDPETPPDGADTSANDN